MKNVINNLNQINKKWYYLSFLILSLILIIPLIYTGNPTFGTDMAFHYNRFYEAAMQIKNWNFSYFMSLYGFESSGRIANAMYGPFFTYLQGLLALVSGTWYRYQLLSNFLIYTTASWSLFTFLEKVKVDRFFAAILASSFATSYAIFQWSIMLTPRSYAYALLPLFLIPTVHYIQKHEFKSLWVGLSMAVVLNIHTLSAIFLAIFYLFLFGIPFIKSSHKIKDFQQLCLSILIFAALTAHIWLADLHVLTKNTVYTVFVNSNLAGDTLDASRSLLFASFGVLVFLMIAVVLAFFNRKTATSFFWIILAIAVMTTLLATNLFPWRFFTAYQIPLMRQIQFPNRFFEYATPFIFIACGLAYQKSKAQFKTLILLCSLPLLAFQVLNLARWNINASTNEYELNTGDVKVVYYAFTDLNGVRESMHSSDLSDFIAAISPKTPDYLPDTVEHGQLTEEESKAYYDLYEKYIIAKHDNFTKTIKGNSIEYSWTSADVVENLEIPAVIYANSQIQLDGEKLTSADYSLTEIGTILLNVPAGEHTLRLTYHSPIWLLPILLWNLFSWPIAMITLLFWRQPKIISRASRRDSSKR